MVPNSINPIHSILFFILAICNLSAILILLKIGFLSFMFFIVYIGAISVLFLFIIMLLNIRILDLRENILNYFPINILLAITFATQLFTIIYKEMSSNILNSISISWLEAYNEISDIETLGLLIYTYYYYYFFIIGLILLIAMLSSIMLTLSHKKFVRRQDLFNQINKAFEKTIIAKNRMNSNIKDNLNINKIVYSFPLFGFQDPSTPFMEGIIDLHNFIFFYLVLILLFVVTLLSVIVYNFYVKLNFPNGILDIALRYETLIGSKVLHGTILEIVWTLIPSLILIMIILPSFALMFSIDEVENFFITLKAIGHQWYWSYEYSLPFKFNNGYGEYRTIKYDSYLKNEDELNIGDLRLLEVDNPIVLPVKLPIRLLVTAADVLHSWTIPSFGVKIDAVPGRLNQVPLFIKREGTFYGQCSELCGVNHAFMPISVKTTTLYKFINWATKQ
jgi:cytochrome c oxidase subunit 2